MKSLHDHFASARRSEPLMDEEGINALLDQYESECPTGPRTDDDISAIHKRGITMKIISIALATAVAGLTPLLLPELREREIKRGGIITSSGERQEKVAAVSGIIPGREIPGREIPVGHAGAAPAQGAVPLVVAMPVANAGAQAAGEDTLVKKDMRPVSFSIRKSGDSAGGPQQRRAIQADIAGIGMVELGADDLARLGIRAGNDGVFAIWQEKGKTSPFIMGFTVSGVTMPRTAEIMDGADIPDFRPVAITDDIGGYRALIYDETQQEQALLEEMRNGGDDAGLDTIEGAFQRSVTERERAIQHAVQIGRLVPVVVRTGRIHTPEDSIAQRNRPDCIFWFEPGRKFLDRLPAEVRERVEREMALDGRLRDAERADDGIAPEARVSLASDIQAAVGESPYLDVLRGAAGAIMESRIEPNPARERALLSYRLSDSRTVALGLHDIAGRRLRELVPSEPMEAGLRTQEIDLRDLAPGIYLVVLSTDRGERAVQRIIVER